MQGTPKKTKRTGAYKIMIWPIQLLEFNSLVSCIFRQNSSSSAFFVTGLVLQKESLKQCDYINVLLFCLVYRFPHAQSYVLFM
jgi:hypothetical protein